MFSWPHSSLASEWCSKECLLESNKQLNHEAKSAYLMTMNLKESTNFNFILNELKDTCDGKIKNIELHYVCIQDFNDNKFSEVIDLRSKEEFDFDNIVGSLSLPVLKAQEKSEILQLSTDQRIRRNALLRYARYSAVYSEDFLQNTTQIS